MSNKLPLQTPNLTAQNIDKIAALFPNCITEMLDEEKSTPDRKVYKRGINFELLKQMLSPDVVDGDEAYEFTWVGKKASIVEANKPIRKTLRPCPEESKNWDDTENLYIEGDNLEVLKLLQESYLGKVKMIYIDPPYNTGNDFIYADDFMRSQDEENRKMGMYDEDENRLFKNNDSNGRFHSDWCSMMYSRLMLARNLLTDDGVIFISIDDCEQENLCKICNEIYSESNFICEFVIASNSSKNNSKFVSITHEYLLCYARDKTHLPTEWSVTRNATEEYCKRANSLVERKLSPNEIHAELGQLTKYPRFYEFDYFTYADSKGVYQTSDLTAPSSKNRFDIIHPITNKPCSLGTRGWAYTEDGIKKLIEEDKIVFGSDETSIPRLKNYLFEKQNLSVLPKSVLFFDSQSTTKWMKSQGFGFDFPKSIDFIKYIVSMYPDKNCVTLDFFSGSATTAHAVMQLNTEDNGHRKFIMVQLPEPCDEKSEAYKAGYKTICDIGKERIRRAGEKVREGSPLTTQNLDIGFRVFKLDDTNMKDVYYSAEEYSQTNLEDLESNIKEDRTDLDLLFGCLLDWGLPLSMPYRSEKIGNCTVHTYAPGDAALNVPDALIACFDSNVPENVIKEIAKRKPRRAVFRDSSFASSPEKINVFEIFKLYAQDTDVKVI